jgi:hypothetical protein
MNRQFIPSSLGEGDYLPSGAYAVSVPGTGVVTTDGLVLPLPPGESAVRYPAIRPDGQIAGQPQNTVRGAWVWTGTSWTTDPRIPVSPNSLIYDNAGFLHVNELGPAYAGANGYRYVTPSNQIISGDATYAARNGVDEWIDLSLEQDGSLLVGYAPWMYACIVWEGTHHRLLEDGNAKRLRAHRSGDTVSIAIEKDGGCALLLGSVADLLALPITEPAPPIEKPPVEKPPLPPAVGPVSQPRAADGQLYDLARFLVPNAARQPRIGPTHAINQIAGPNGMLYFVKFGNVATLETGRAYEMWAYDDNWIYHLEDASGAPPMSFSDPRMYPRYMRIGEQHAFKTGPHKGIFRQRDSHCEVLREDDFDRKMWLHAVWDDWDWGPDLGHLETVMLVYDNTDQAELPGRYVETGYYGDVGASGCRWEAYHAEGVYPNGPQHGAVFPPSALSSRSDFYLLGGPSPSADLTGCVPAVCPHYPPLPTPEPEPPKGPTVLYVFSSPNSFAVDECKKLDNGDGTLFAQRTKDNLYLSRDSGGNIHWVATAASDETFILSTDGGALISRNLFPDAKHATFAAIPCKETL